MSFGFLPRTRSLLTQARDLHTDFEGLASVSAADATHRRGGFVVEPDAGAHVAFAGQHRVGRIEARPAEFDVVSLGPGVAGLLQHDRALGEPARRVETVDAEVAADVARRDPERARR